MNAHGMAFFPHLESNEVIEFRKKYDPTAAIIGEHMTVLYPVPETVKPEALDDHIESVLKRHRPFKVHFQGLRKSWDHWLLLSVQEGKEKVVRLHDDLYSGILKPFLRNDIPYEPYMALGLFAAKDYDPLNPVQTSLRKDIYDHAYEEAASCDFNFWSGVEKLILLELRGPDIEINSIKEYVLEK